MLIAMCCSTTRCLCALYRVLDRMWSPVNKDDQAGTGTAWELVPVKKPLADFFNQYGPCVDIVSVTLYIVTGWYTNEKACCVRVWL